MWYKDGDIIKGGNNQCCLPVTSPGAYHVVVSCRERAEVSEASVIGTFSNLFTKAKKKNNSASETKNVQIIDMYCQNDAATMQKNNRSPVAKDVVPHISREELTFTSADEIGHGNFGTVYKAKWAGRDVAIKCLKVKR